METTRLDDEAAEAAPLFENRDWRLHADGLEHRETGYFIDRDTLNARRPDGHWEWPLHLSEKSWCGVRSFREAFAAALEAFGIAPDRKLTLSFALGFGTRVGGAAPDAFVPLADLVRPRAPAPRPVAAFRPLVAASA